MDVYAGNLDEIATVCKTLGSRVIFTGPIAVDETRTLPHENGYYYSNRDVRAYGARAREVADDHGAYLDLTPALADEEGDSLALRDPTLLVDGMHPGTAGFARIFDVAKQALASLLPFDFPDD
jgi:lysophospholipase L1-like esterase